MAPSAPTDRRFIPWGQAGQREENGLGSLYDYGARFCVPARAGALPRAGTLPQRGYDRAGSG